MNLDKETKDKIDKLPIILKTTVNYLLDAIDNIVNGKCDEDTLTSTIGTLNENSKRRYADEDLMNYDEAGKSLGFGCTNRNALKRLLDKNGIKQVIINNKKCGFKRSDIYALKDKIKNDKYNKKNKNN